MTTAELNALLGREGVLATPVGKVDGLAVFVRFDVVITDAREVFGRLDLKFRPVAGSGEGWASNAVIPLK